RLAVARLVQPGHDLQDGRLAGPVGADHPDLGSGEEGHRDVIEDDLLVVRLARTHHGVDVVGHGGRLSTPRPHARIVGQAHADSGTPPSCSSLPATNGSGAPVSARRASSSLSASTLPVPDLAYCVVP